MDDDEIKSTELSSYFSFLTAVAMAKACYARRKIRE